MTYKITLIPGDGIGPEISQATQRVIDATGVPIEWEVMEAGESAIARGGNPLPPEVLESVRRNKVALKGPITTPVGKGFRSVNVGLRKSLDLYANVRPCKSRKGVRSRYDNIDLVVVRENTEDLYAGIEFHEGTPEVAELIAWIAEKNGARIRPDSAISIKPISITGSRRIVEFAFKYAEENGRKKVSAVHKANIMKATDGLYLRVAEEVSRQHPNVQFENVIVDNMCMQLVQKPDLYDVLVLPNLYGDILSDLCAGLVGGLGVAPGANIGEEVALFEPIHGSAPKYAGQNKVNPMAMMYSGVMMLRWINEHEAADRLERALDETIAEGVDVTYDLKQRRDDPTAKSTSEVADALIEKVRA
ncbi:MAG TPA: isocitrate/isopropylmalate dehydrogenase family protein [Chloroflexia bacterium]|nr:isocitrate/isopropylmalate dehydrogenase family protein [Chloroflexia bacterium]